MKEVTSTTGEPLEVDGISLMRAGPIRVKVYCKDPSQINCLVEIFINFVGYEIKFEAEGSFATKKGGPYKVSGDRKPDRKDEKDEEEEDESNDSTHKTEWEKLLERFGSDTQHFSDKKGGGGNGKET